MQEQELDGSFEVYTYWNGETYKRSIKRKLEEAMEFCNIKLRKTSMM